MTTEPFTADNGKTYLPGGVVTVGADGTEYTQARLIKDGAVTNFRRTFKVSDLPA